MPKRKLVMDEFEGSVVASVIAEGCDPITKVTEGSLEDALAQVPQLLTEAEEKWAGSPRMPKYQPPKAEKAKAEPEKPSEELPLLAGEKEKPEEAPAPAPTEAPTEVPTEVPVEATTAEGPVEGEPGHETPVFPAEETPAVEESTADISQRIAAAPATTEEPTEPVTVEEKPAEEETKVEGPAVTGEWEYYLKDGRGPFSDIQSAMDEMGLDKAARPHHARWDRLSSQLKKDIQRRPKA